MPTIHPSATIDPKAQLATNVTIGPGCVIEGPVEIGEGTTLTGQVYLQGPVVIGRDNTLYPFVCVGFDPQHRQYEGPTAGVRIGDRNVLRESVTVHASMDRDTPTLLGDDNYLMTNSHVGHDTHIGHRVTMASGALLGGHVEVGDDATLSGNSAVHQFCRIGRLSMLGGVSALKRDLPPFILAQGLNAVIGLNVVGLRRAGLSSDAIGRLKKAFELLFKSGLGNRSARERLEALAADGGDGAACVSELAEFVRTSERGLCSYRGTQPEMSRRQAIDRTNVTQTG